MNSQYVYIIVLNYKTWEDTLECIESLLNLNYCNYRIIVVENCSPNKSYDEIIKWAKNKNSFTKESLNILPYIELEEDKILTNIGNNLKLIFIKTKSNGGYSAGNNVGIRLAMFQGNAEYIWILNNDLIVEPDSLKNLVTKSLFYKENNKKIGIIGSKVMDYYKPTFIQSAGGYSLNLITASLIKPLGGSEKDLGQWNIEVNPDYIAGCSMFINTEFIKRVGLMEEKYFLYFEELDWAIRGKKEGGWQLGYAWDAIVYHKEGKSTNSSKKNISPLTEFYYQRNKILFTKKYFRWNLPFVYATLIFLMISKISKGQFSRFLNLLKVIFRPYSNFQL